MVTVTANEVAGLVVGAMLLGAALAAPKVDAFIAKSQRRDLRLCENCGGLKAVPCKKCKGRGTIKASISFLGFQDGGGGQDAACTACRGQGSFPCSTCLDNPLQAMKK